MGSSLVRMAIGGPLLLALGGVAWRFIHPRTQSSESVEKQLQAMVEPIIHFQQGEFDAWWEGQEDGVARARPGRSHNVDEPQMLALIEEHGCPELGAALDLHSESGSVARRELLEGLWQVRFRQSEVAWRGENRPKSRSAGFEEQLEFTREDEDNARLSYGLIHREQTGVSTGGIDFVFRYGWRGVEWLPLGWCIESIEPSIDRAAVHET